MKVGPFIGLVTLLTVGVVGLFASADCSTTTAAEIHAQIERDLPLGASRLEVLSWLDAEGVEYISETKASAHSALDKKGIAPTADVVFAIIDAGGVDLLVERRVDVYFVFDSEARLTDFVVQDASTGL